MDSRLTRGLRRLSFGIAIGMDFNFDTDCDDHDFTIGTSSIKCVKTREATSEIGGFAQYCYLVDDELVIVDRSHRFSLRKNRKEIANCFVSTTEIYIALTDFIENAMDTEGNTREYLHRITFSETEDPRVVLDGEPLFTEPTDILQISAECRLLGDRVEMRNVQILHESLFELNELYYE